MSVAGRAKRNAFDSYKTPNEAIEPLWKRLFIDLSAEAFEPCLGDGNIARSIPCNNVMYCELSEGVDYLSGKTLPAVDLVVTNPPFSLAQEFLSVSFTHCRGVVAYLLRLNYLGSQKRKDWWQGKTPTHLYVLSERPSFNWDGRGTDATEYAWFVWDFNNSSLVRCKDTPGIYIL